MKKVSYKSVQQVWNILLKSQLSRFVQMHEVLLHMCLVLRALLILALRMRLDTNLETIESLENLEKLVCLMSAKKATPPRLIT